MITLEPAVWPTLRYDDAPTGLRFLVDVIGFRETLVVPDGDGDITHAELRWPEGGAVMLSSAKRCGAAHSASSVGATAVYVVTDQVDAVHQRCLSAGADIASGPADTDYGSNAFSVRDPEGNLWTVGTYRGAGHRTTQAAKIAAVGVRRVVPHLATRSLDEAKHFYGEVLGLRPVMDHGWIVTLADPDSPTAQLSLMTHDDTAPVIPAASIEVDDVDACHAAAIGAGAEIVHPLTDEPWGVRRFFVRDPDGHVINILAHL
jgi:uncharacterized glyoxalase superfamily protein PhnB